MFQPEALRLIHAGAAYDLGLTGAGIRVGIEDNAVNVLLPEFEGRVGVGAPARPTYLYPDGGDYMSLARQCERKSAARQRAAGCAVYAYDPDSGLTLAQRVVEVGLAGLLKPGFGCRSVGQLGAGASFSSLLPSPF